MTYKELVDTFSSKMNVSSANADEMIQLLVKEIQSQLSDGKTIGIQGFGALELKKKEERLSVHPATQVRTLIPPKLVVNFKQSSLFKTKLKDLKAND